MHAIGIARRVWKGRERGFVMPGRGPPGGLLRWEGKFLRLAPWPRPRPLFPPRHRPSCLPPRCFHLAAAAYLAWGLIWAKSGGGHVHGKGAGRQNSGAPWVARELFLAAFLRMAME